MVTALFCSPEALKDGGIQKSSPSQKDSVVNLALSDRCWCPYNIL